MRRVFRFWRCGNIGFRLDNRRVCLQEGPSFRFKPKSKFFFKRPVAVYICKGGSRKVNKISTSTGNILENLDYATPESGSRGTFLEQN